MDPADASGALRLRGAVERVAHARGRDGVLRTFRRPGSRNVPFGAQGHVFGAMDPLTSPSERANVDTIGNVRHTRAEYQLNVRSPLTMKASRASRTAVQMALSRAIEARRPPADRICYDPFAEQFLHNRYRALLVARPLRNAVEMAIEHLFPGHHHYVLVRTQYIDDFLLARLAHDIRQLVILGAGFDSRPYRFADWLRNVSVFEVDHPATSELKRATIVRALGATATRVTYVPVDFDREDLACPLERAGYDSDHRTVFLCEGVTPYVSSQGVDATLEFVSARSGKGSAILFDYVLRDALDGTCDLRGAQNECQKMKRTNEPFMFGIGGGQVEGFLSARGFERICDVGADYLARQYLHGSRATSYVKPWWRIVHAEVV